MSFQKEKSQSIDIEIFKSTLQELDHSHIIESEFQYKIKELEKLLKNSNDRQKELENENVKLTKSLSVIQKSPVIYTDCLIIGQLICAKRDKAGTYKVLIQTHDSISYSVSGGTPFKTQFLIGKIVLIEEGSRAVFVEVDSNLTNLLNQNL
jgi:hypothetical protein